TAHRFVAVATARPTATGKLGRTVAPAAIGTNSWVKLTGNRVCRAMTPTIPSFKAGSRHLVLTPSPLLPVSRPTSKGLPNMPHPTAGQQLDPANHESMNRRSFLRTSAVLTSGLAALAASLAPLRDVDDFPTLERFIQKYYKELTPDEMARVLKRIENEVE